MTSLLLLVSFLIHLILFIALYHLYQRVSQDKQEQHIQSERIEQLLMSFLEEIRLENEKLDEKISRPSFQQNKAFTETNKQDNYKNKVNDYHSLDSKTLHVNKDRQDQVETSFEGQTLQLYNEGYSIDEIAQKLKRGKREVQLLLKMKESL